MNFIYSWTANTVSVWIYESCIDRCPINFDELDGKRGVHFITGDSAEKCAVRLLVTIKGVSFVINTVWDDPGWISRRNHSRHLLRNYERITMYFYSIPHDYRTLTSTLQLQLMAATSGESSSLLRVRTIDYGWCSLLIDSTIRGWIIKSFNTQAHRINSYLEQEKWSCEQGRRERLRPLRSGDPRRSGEWNSSRACCGYRKFTRHNSNGGNCRTRFLGHRIIWVTCYRKKGRRYGIFQQDRVDLPPYEFIQATTWLSILSSKKQYVVLNMYRGVTK